MAIEIIQSRITKPENPNKRDPDAIEIEINIQGWRRAGMRVVFLAHFGENVKWADYYALGYDNAKPVLVPVSEGGYKTHKVNTSTAGWLRFCLTDEAIEIFGKDVAERIRHDIKAYEEWEEANNRKENVTVFPVTYGGHYEYTGRIDDERRVWIEKE